MGGERHGLILVTLAASVSSAKSANLELADDGSAVVFGGTNPASLRASCGFDSPAIRDLHPAEIDLVRHTNSSVSVALLNVKPNCVNVPPNQPCAAHSPGTPARFHCLWRGIAGAKADVVETGPVVASRHAVVENGVVVASDTVVHCPLPGIEAIARLVGHDGQSSDSAALWLSIRHGRAINSWAQVLAYDATAGEPDGNRVWITGLPMPPPPALPPAPPLAPPPSPFAPPSSPPPPSPPPPRIGTSCLAIKETDPAASSGWYQLVSGDFDLMAFCEMEHEGGGWTRVVLSLGGDTCGIGPIDAEWVQPCGEQNCKSKYGGPYCNDASDGQEMYSAGWVNMWPGHPHGEEAQHDGIPKTVPAAGGVEPTAYSQHAARTRPLCLLKCGACSHSRVRSCLNAAVSRAWRATRPPPCTAARTRWRTP